MISVSSLARRIALLVALSGAALACSNDRSGSPPASRDTTTAAESTAPGRAPVQAARGAGTQAARVDDADNDDSHARCPDLAEVPSSVPAPARLVAIGDLHGDLQGAREVFQLAGAVDGNGDWMGGELVVVQTGDILDRGDGERAIIDWLVRVREQARAAGGAVYLLNGNHELMNAGLDFRYVTEGGFAEFADIDTGLQIGQVHETVRGRVHAFHPGGPYARILAAGNVVQIVGDTVFAHGGVMPAYAEYGIDRLNRELRCWLADPTASAETMPAAGRDSNGPVWSRHYALQPADCESLERALGILGASRMVVGHTTQLFGITSACNDKIWRIDTGISAHYGGPRQVLEISGDRVEVLEQ